MARTDYNFAQYCACLQTPKVELFRKIRARMIERGIKPVSINTLTRYSFGDSQTDNEKILEVLSEVTGIDKSNLFKF